MNFENFDQQNDEGQFTSQFDKAFKDFNKKASGKKKRQKKGKTSTRKKSSSRSPDRVALQNSIIDTARAQQKFDEDYFNLFEPRQIEIQQ